MDVKEKLKRIRDYAKVFYESQDEDCGAAEAEKCSALLDEVEDALVEKAWSDDRVRKAMVLAEAELNTWSEWDLRNFAFDRLVEEYAQRSDEELDLLTSERGLES